MKQILWCPKLKGLTVNKVSLHSFSRFNKHVESISFPIIGKLKSWYCMKRKENIVIIYLAMSPSLNGLLIVVVLIRTDTPLHRRLFPCIILYKLSHCAHLLNEKHLLKVRCNQNICFQKTLMQWQPLNTSSSVLNCVSRDFTKCE